MISTEVIPQPEPLPVNGGSTFFVFFFNTSMVNAYILEKLAGRKKRCQLAFRIDFAKMLIGGYNGYKCPSNSGKRAIKTVTREENLRGPFLGKLEGMKKACAMCAKNGMKQGEGRTFESSYGYEQCGVALCKQMPPRFGRWVRTNNCLSLCTFLSLVNKTKALGIISLSYYKLF